MPAYGHAHVGLPISRQIPLAIFSRTILGPSSILTTFQYDTHAQLGVLSLALLLLLSASMKFMTSRPTPQSVSREIQAYVAERQGQLLPSGEASRDGRRFSWCGDILDFLAEGLAERVASLGITFSSPFPGPLRLMDEVQQPDGQHVRRFWTVALHQGCPIARICTVFFHRHDQISLPQTPLVMAFATHRQASEDAE